MFNSNSWLQPNFGSSFQNASELQVLYELKHIIPLICVYNAVYYKYE